jgi:TldD protein
MEGSHIEQVFLFLFPEARVHTGGSTETLEIGGTVEGIGWCAGGYEVFKRVNLAAAMRRAAESIEHVRLHQLDVGRYELVADAAVMAGLVSGTLLPATDLDRALGSRSDGVGTSFAAPPTDVLGRLAMATPQLTVRANRTLVGGLMTVGWDDEGVPPDDVVLINHGILVDYQTMRANASQLAGWYRGRGATVRSHGGAVAFVMGMPINGLPNFTVAPASHAATVKDLIGDVKRGIYLSGAGGAAGDFQLLSAYGGASMAQEIRNGRLVGYLSDVAINFRTREFWQGLLTVGGDNAVSTVTLGEQGPFTCCTVQSPPASFLGVNVNRTDRLL